ncbi:tetratricopeptide repeat protein [Pseudanabaena yagii]|nr:tetratricopeptide repeat protein [Pseudanabaena yagii]
MTDPLAEKLGINVRDGTVNVQNLNLGIAERLEQSGDRVRILVVAANPLGSSPLKLDHEVKTIQEALRRSRKRDNFAVEYRLAATPSELRRALLDLEPHVLHFSGHGAGDRGLLFVSDESMGSLYRSDDGAVRSRSTNSDEIKFVPAQPLANLLQLCEDHLECVVLNACYSDVQGNAISANILFTIGMRDQVADNVAIKFSQGFYDAIGAGKGYEKAFEWGKVAIEFDLANNEASQILVLRKKGESFSQSIPVPPQIPVSQPNPQRSLSATECFDGAYEKYELGDKQGAIADYNEALLLNPNDAIAYSNRGVAKYELGDKQGAIADYNEAIHLNPNLVAAYSNRGLAKYDLGDKQGAIADHNEAIRLNPDYATAYYNRGLAKYDLGDKQGAIADHNEAIRFNPSDADPYNNRGVAKYELGDKQGAIADHNEAIRLNPNLAAAYSNRGLAKYDLGDKQGAIADHNEAIRLNPDYATAYYNRGLAKYDLGDKQGAIADYNEVIRLNPNLADAYSNRGIAKSVLGDKQGAIADYNEAIRLNPDNANAYNGLAWIKYLMGNSQEALLDVEQSLRFNPSYSAAYHTRGAILFYGLRRPQDAIAAFTKAISLEYNDSESYCDRGIVMASLGDTQKAIADFNQAIRFNSFWDARSLADAYHNRGNAYQQIGEGRNALVDFRKASELYQQQGRASDYDDVQNRIRELG